MLVRRESDETVLCIGQAAHAALSGQLARGWRDDEIGERAEDVRLAATQHDLGWLSWDAAPELDEQTGLPIHFTAMPTERWTALWSPVPLHLATQSAYAAALVSMHGARLMAGRPPAEAYIAEQEAIQARLLAQAGVDRRVATRHRDLLMLWDGLSLALCLQWGSFTLGDTRLEPVADDDAVEENQFTLEPWPLAVRHLELCCEGRVLQGTFADTASLRAALDAAPLRALRFHLGPID